MTFFFGDGFDCYRDLTDCVTYWDAPLLASTTLVLAATGRFAGSRSLMPGGASNTAYMTKTSGSNDAVHHLSFAVQQTSGAGSAYGTYLYLVDGATTQCTVALVNDGSLRLLSGNITGSILAIYTGAVPQINTWYQFEVEVVIHPTAGRFRVRKNGNTSDDFDSGATLNTRSSANNYANKIGLGSSVGTVVHNIDDFLWRSDASSVPWIGDVRCYTRMPAVDSAVQFSRSGSVVPVTPFVATTTGNINTGVARYSPFTATCDGTISTASVSLSAAYTGNMKCTIFNNGGSNTPGTVLSSATAINNPAVGNNTFTFSSPPSVTRGTTYWIGFSTDTTATAANLSTLQAGAYSSSGITNGVAYASFPVANPGTLTVNTQTHIFTVNITPATAANANLVSEVVQDAAGGYVLSNTNGQADLYTLQTIPSTPFLPATVIGVTTRGLFQKSDAGTRNATVQLKSGGVTVAGASTALPVGSWQWIARNDLVDPATSAAWTPSGVNAALVGPAVTV